MLAAGRIESLCGHAGYLAVERFITQFTPVMTIVESTNRIPDLSIGMLAFCK